MFEMYVYTRVYYNVEPRVVAGRPRFLPVLGQVQITPTVTHTCVHRRSPVLEKLTYLSSVPYLPFFSRTLQIQKEVISDVKRENQFLSIDIWKSISLLTSYTVYSVADPVPGSGAFMTPGSGMGKKSGSGSGIRNEQPGSYFLELRNQFFGLKYLNL
jgi:hypothetical protein